MSNWNVDLCVCDCCDDDDNHELQDVDKNPEHSSQHHNSKRDRNRNDVVTVQVEVDCILMYFISVPFGLATSNFFEATCHHSDGQRWRMMRRLLNAVSVNLFIGRHTDSYSDSLTHDGMKALPHVPLIPLTLDWVCLSPGVCLRVHFRATVCYGQQKESTTLYFDVHHHHCMAFE